MTFLPEGEAVVGKARQGFQPRTGAKREA